MSKQTDWYFRAHPGSVQESINWLPTLIRMKVFKVFPRVSTASGRQRRTSFYNEDEHEWETRKKGSMYQKKGARKKRYKADHSLEFGPIHFYSTKKISLDPFHSAFSEVKIRLSISGVCECV